MGSEVEKQLMLVNVITRYFKECVIKIWFLLASYPVCRCLDEITK